MGGEGTVPLPGKESKNENTGQTPPQERPPEPPRILQNSTGSGFRLFHCRSGNDYDATVRSEETLLLRHDALFFILFTPRS